MLQGLLLNLLLLGLLDALSGLLQGLLSLLGVALLERLRRVRKVLGDLRVALLKMLGLLAEVRSCLLALLRRHLVELLRQLVELLSGLLQARALAGLAPRETLEIARHLLERGAARVSVRVDALLQLSLDG